jgi:hypothetical protein
VTKLLSVICALTLLGAAYANPKNTFSCAGGGDPIARCSYERTLFSVGNVDYVVGVSSSAFRDDELQITAAPYLLVSYFADFYALWFEWNFAGVNAKGFMRLGFTYRW